MVGGWWVDPDKGDRLKVQPGYTGSVWVQCYGDHCFFLSLYLSTHKPQTIHCAPLLKSPNPRDNLIYSSYSNTPQICSVDYLQTARHSNCFPKVLFNRFNLQLNREQKRNANLVCVFISRYCFISQRQSDNWLERQQKSGQLRKSIHIQLWRQRATVCMNRGTVCRWMVLKHPIMHVVVLKLPQVSGWQQRASRL